jgi:predicted nucleic acid-binding protein
VKILFDTSVLVAAMVAAHPKHNISLPWLQQVLAEEVAGFISSHSLAELYAVLTRLPLRPAIKPALAAQLISENLQGFQIIPLSTEDYKAVIANLVSLQIPGAAIYDALIAQAALNSNIDVLLTLNPKHFQRLGEFLAEIVQVPG